VVEVNPETGASTVKEIEALGGRALAIQCDIRRRPAVNAAIAATVGAFGTVDILVNNAQGVRVPEAEGVSIEDTTDEHIAESWEPGFMGTFYFMQGCFPYMREHGGKIINVGSAAGVTGKHGMVAYAATKEAVRALTRVAAHDWGKYGISVNIFCPLALTPSVQEGAIGKSPQRLRYILENVPLGRIGDPERDIGRAVLAMVSSDFDYVTGQTIMLDGGANIL
jgi:2-hydroxycyclohexanecarboxyl-CoA dehydrogenase